MNKSTLYSEHSIVNWDLHHLLNKTSEKTLEFLKKNKSRIFRTDLDETKKGKDSNNS